MKIYKGIVKKLPLDTQFEQFKNNEIKLSDLTLADTITVNESGENSFETLAIRLSYQELDKNGNEKYIFDENSQAYIRSYKQTPVLYASGKEMRILVELGEYAPVKIVTEQKQSGEFTYQAIVCVQNQHMGLE